MSDLEVSCLHLPVLVLFKNLQRGYLGKKLYFAIKTVSPEPLSTLFLFPWLRSDELDNSVPTASTFTFETRHATCTRGNPYYLNIPLVRSNLNLSASSQ